ncbi:protein of unknown function [Lactiplantibacillus plantarum]
MVNTILKEADLFCPNSVRINFTIYHTRNSYLILSLYHDIGRRSFINYPGLQFVNHPNQGLVH